MKNDNLGDRMKGYENITRYKATRKVPLMIRVDGKAFHTLTKKAEKPFDPLIMNAMKYAAFQTANEMQGFKVAYVQSDEVTFLLTDFDNIKTDGWFDYNIQKIASITAAYMSVHFKHYLDKRTTFTYANVPVFDARVFSVPKEDVVNCFLWRAKDWKRNSLSMYCQSMFSHKQLHGMNQAAQHELLKEFGKSWENDLTDIQKYGTFLYKAHQHEKGLIAGEIHLEAEYNEISKIIDRFL